MIDESIAMHPHSLFEKTIWRLCYTHKLFPQNDLSRTAAALCCPNFFTSPIITPAYLTNKTSSTTIEAPVLIYRHRYCCPSNCTGQSTVDWSMSISPQKRYRYGLL